MVGNHNNCVKALIERLKFSWCDLLAKLSADSQSGDCLFSMLINAYGDRNRSYHNLKHIDELLGLLERVKDSSDNFNALGLAAWFHDYIYNPQAADNEIRSAAYARKAMKELNIDSQTIEVVTQIILSTQHHIPLIDGIDNLIFLDVDLGILGSKPERYQQYARSIRQEYNHLSDRDYCQGRTKVLKQFLAKSRIYYTDYFYQQLESQARNNLQAEIELLNSNQPSTISKKCSNH